MSTQRSRAIARALAFVALGSNLGEPLAQLRQARRGLGTLGEVKVSSSLYRTTPVGGPSAQPDYLNAAIALYPKSEPERLLRELFGLEAQAGRERAERWAARTLDLDLLAFGEEVWKSDGLTLPHPRMMERAFVLGPLCEIAPGWRHPVSKENACAALAHLSNEGITRTDLTWI